jgi:hypothetical protein
MTISKEKVEEKKSELMRLALGFSQEYLNKEYDDLIEKLVLKMTRKREVPFLTGRIEIWAAAVIHALGTVNFLFDKESSPYVPVSEIYQYFNTSQSTTSQKSKNIRDMFKMSYFDNSFATDSVRQSNPLNNMIILNGLIVPKD